MNHYTKQQRDYAEVLLAIMYRYTIMKFRWILFILTLRFENTD